ncbi:hypothetical protein GCM10009765_33610 [Fodinicola feengrottensis]|uniref:Uncharacterized protein n=1 Tax=Fodinicola feengrottensis TaxID=435914 RepID=A0ABN2H4E3_9ACTN
MAPDFSGAFGAGAVDYGYESRSSDPAKTAGSEDRRPCRRGDNIGLAADGAERGWEPSKLADYGLKVPSRTEWGDGGLGNVEVGRLWAESAVPHEVG